MRQKRVNQGRLTDFSTPEAKQEVPFPGLLAMELAGLEPATSWVRSSRSPIPKVTLLQRFMGERLECRNISPNSLHRVLQRHEILDRSAGAIRRGRGRTHS